MSRETRKAPIGTSVIKGILWKMWALSRRKWETWLTVTYKALNNFFVLVFTGRCSSHTIQVVEGKDMDRKNEEPHTVGDQIQDHLRNFNVHTESDEMHLLVLRESENEAAKTLSIIFKKLWQPVETLSDWKQRNKIPILKDRKEELGNYRIVSLTSVPSKIREQIFLETMTWYIENKEVIGDSYHGFSEAKLCLTNLVAIYSGVTVLVDKRRASDSIFRDLCKAFHTAVPMTSLCLSWRGMDLIDGPLGG